MATFTNTQKNMATQSSLSKSATATFTNTNMTRYEQYTLLEDTFFVLFEDGTKIILEQSIPQYPAISNVAKS